MPIWPLRNVRRRNELTKDFSCLYGHFATYEDVTNLRINWAVNYSRFNIREIRIIIPFDDVIASFNDASCPFRIISRG